MNNLLIHLLPSSTFFLDSKLSFADEQYEHYPKCINMNLDLEKIVRIILDLKL